MKNYLSFGGGVNSVAMMLLLLDEGVEFEAVYVWMPDWPETHEYLMMLEDKGYPITVIFPYVRRGDRAWSNLYDSSLDRAIYPSRQRRWCTAEFKITPLREYYQKPCFQMLGIDIGESHRAKIGNNDGIENRFPLIEREINRAKCKEIIKSHRLPLPPKSGCYFCPFQKMSEYRQLRYQHPELFCKAVNLEKKFNGRRISQNKSPYYIKGIPLEKMIEPVNFLFADMAYPPCQCGL